MSAEISKKIGLKFRIKSILANLPEAERVETRKKICEACGITDETFSRKINVKSDDSLDFLGYQAILIAQTLDVPVTDLYNKY
jgi:hypothetical protein